MILPNNTYYMLINYSLPLGLNKIYPEFIL